MVGNTTFLIIFAVFDPSPYMDKLQFFTNLLFRNGKAVIACIRFSLEHSNSGKKSIDSILAIESIFFDSIGQSDKFAACTLIIK